MGNRACHANALSHAASADATAMSQLNRKRGRAKCRMLKPSAEINRIPTVKMICMVAVEFYQFWGIGLHGAQDPFGRIPSLMKNRGTTLTCALSGACVLAACGYATAPPAWPLAATQDIPRAEALAPTEPPPTREADNHLVEPSMQASSTPWAQKDLTDLVPGPANESPAPVLSTFFNPLTGLPVEDPTLLHRRPLAIKISNYPRDIRPQFGLNEADVVFEYYIEWGYTRFIGIFLGNNASQIGPVRSGRYFDEHIARMYHAYYVFNYADPREYQYFLGGDLRDFVVVPGYGLCPPFFEHRFSARIADVSHYETYFDSTRFSECLARKATDNAPQELRPTIFETSTLLTGPRVDRIFFHFSRCDYSYWQYNTESQDYLRFQEASPSTDIRHLNDCQDEPRTHKPLVDSVSGDQVGADNVIVVFASHSFADEDEQDDEIYHIDLIDAGRAYVFRDGRGEPARWVRTDVDQPLLITTPTGEPFALKPGRTFFEVLGETSDAWSERSDWFFEFHTP